MTAWSGTLPTILAGDIPTGDDWDLILDLLHALSDNETSYTPAWTSGGTAPNIGNGTLVGGYARFGKRVRAWVRLTWGSTTTGGTGRWLLTLPVAPVHSNALTALCWDASATIPYPAVAQLDSSEHIARIGAHTAAGVVGVATATHPFTWTTSDILFVNGEFEVA